MLSGRLRLAFEWVKTLKVLDIVTRERVFAYIDLVKWIEAAAVSFADVPLERFWADVLEKRGLWRLSVEMLRESMFSCNALDGLKVLMGRLKCCLNNRDPLIDELCCVATRPAGMLVVLSLMHDLSCLTT